MARIIVGVKIINGVRYADYEGPYTLLADSEHTMEIEPTETIESLTKRINEQEAIIDALLGVE
jgi:hypothetical protein